MVEKGLWEYASEDEVCPSNVALATPTRGEGRGATIVVRPRPPTLDQKRWDTKNVQAMIVIALTIKLINHTTNLLIQDIIMCLGCLVDYVSV